MRLSQEQLKGYMLAEGFINVEVTDFKWPMGPLPEDQRLKVAGGLAMLSMLEHMSGLSLAGFTRYLGMDRTEVEVFLTQVRRVEEEGYARLLAFVS
jgi:hypothetical protein